MSATFLLIFTLCGATADPAIGGLGCEEGEIRARSCEIALAYVQGGMRPGQTLHVSSCEVA